MPPNQLSLIYIIGPTAAGKTALGIALARELGGEIINADSRQVYRYMDIGTAKPTAEERSQVPHHLFDLLDPDENFSLGRFLALAKAKIEEIRKRGKTPMVVGGTGQYIRALQEGWEAPEIGPDEKFRRELEAEATDQGPAALYRRLEAIDPERAGELDPRNVRRVIRALEIHQVTGRVPSALQGKAGEGRPGLMIGLTMERSRLYDRIGQRVDRMMEDGLLEEVKGLAERGYSLGKGPLACPGYRELGQYLAGEIALEEAVQRTKFQTHRLVRRQYTWFKAGDARISWLDAEEEDLVEAAMRLATGYG